MTLLLSLLKLLIILFFSKVNFLSSSLGYRNYFDKIPADDGHHLIYFSKLSISIKALFFCFYDI